MDIIHLDRLDVSTDLPKSAVGQLQQLGVFRDYNDRPSPGEATRRLGDTDIAIIECTEVTSPMLEHVQRLKCIVVGEPGYRHVDVIAAKQKGIVVCNTPGYSRQSVAEHVFALIFALGRRLAAANQLSRAEVGVDNYIKHGLSLELSGKTLGVWGLGSIGSWVARIGNGFGMRVVGSDVVSGNIPGVERLATEEVLRASDIFCICVDINPTTTNFLTRNRLSQMKPGAFLVNITDNTVLDERAVADLLNCGKLAGAAFDDAPKPTSPLREAQGTFFTPNIGWYTQSSLDRRASIIVDTVAAFIRGEPRLVVNP